MLYKLKALEIYFYFCHVNSLNGLKGPDFVGRTSRCTVCRHIKIHKGKFLGKERSRERSAGVRKDGWWGDGDTESSNLTRGQMVQMLQWYKEFCASSFGLLMEISSCILWYFKIWCLCFQNISLHSKILLLPQGKY